VDINVSGGANVTFGGVTSITRATMTAVGAGMLLFPAAVSYLADGGNQTIEAEGPGSRINLSAFSTFTRSNGSTTIVNVIDGGEVDLGGHVSGNVDIMQDGPSSILPLHSVTKFTGVELKATSGATLTFSAACDIDFGANVIWETDFSSAVSVHPSAKLDYLNNDFIYKYGASSPYTMLRQLVIQGFGNNPGITSSTSTGAEILALFDNALVGGGSWNGIGIGLKTIIGKYTYFGDANVDGQVTGDDYTVIDANLNTTPPVGLEWLSGDMSLDGSVTGDDYTVIDANLGLGVGMPLAQSPASSTRRSLVDELGI
jgi:hypothetical protein